MQGPWNQSMAASEPLPNPSGDTRAGSPSAPKHPWRFVEWNGYFLLAPRRTLWRDRLSETPPTVSLRKEVIQPQVLLRLPCYDFTPVMNHTLGLFD